MSDHNKLIEPPAQNPTTRIPGDVVNRATENLPDNQRSAIRRLHAHYIEKALGLDDVAKLVNLSGSTVSLIFRGKYEAKLDGVVKEIERFFELDDQRSKGRRLDFIPTALTERIWGVCAAALEFQKIAFIFGDQQIGKSEALKAYALAHNHGSTVYVSMPTGGTLTNFLVALARVLRISENLSVVRMRERVKAAFDDRMLLIVDEAHRCVREGTTRGVDAIEYIREIYDERQCGLVICATNVFRDEMETGPAQKLFRQIKRRRLCALQLPNQPTTGDLNKFAAAYGLPPAEGTARELEKQLIESEALGMWLTLLRMGAKTAKERKQPMSWGHVITAERGLRALEGK